MPAPPICPGPPGHKVWGGAGFKLIADCKVIASRETLGRLEVVLP